MGHPILVLMQSLPLARHEVVSLLTHKVTKVQAAGLSREQAVAVLSRELKLDPAKIAALVDVQESR